MPSLLKNFCLLMLFSLCCAFSSSADAAQKAAVTEITLAYQPFATPSGALLEVIKRDRLLRQGLEQQGIILKTKLLNKGSDAFEGLRNKTLQVTTLGEMPLLEVAATTPLIVIGQHKQNFASIVTLRGSTPKNLKGKRVGNAFATSGHLALIKTLKHAGLDERDITIVQMDVADMPDALLQGKIDAFAAWEPTPSIVIAKHPDRFSSIGRHANSAYFIIEQSSAARHPEIVRLFAASMARAMNWVLKDRANLRRAATWNIESMQQLSSKPSIMSVDELSRQIVVDLQHINNTARLHPQVNRQTSQLGETLEFLKTTGKLPQTVQWDQLRNVFKKDVMEQVYRTPSASGINRFDYDLK